MHKVFYKSIKTSLFYTFLIKIVYIVDLIYDCIITANLFVACFQCLSLKKVLFFALTGVQLHFN